MRLLLITSFPPSTRACNSFGYHAVLRFLEFPKVNELIVLADLIDNDLSKGSDGILPTDKKFIINRCWHYNSVRCVLDIINLVLHYDPNVVWINLQYTTFGVKPIPAFLGLCIPAILRFLRYPTVILLHNYLGGVELDKMGLSQLGIRKAIIKLADRLVMRSIMLADKIFTMVNEYRRDLLNKFPGANVEYVRQDLFAVSPFRPVNGFGQILTIGYFGTYKRLEILLDAFEIVRQNLPNARLVVAGMDSMHTPGYIQQLQKIYCNKLDNVEFTGYVEESSISDLFWQSNLIVITNSTSSGSSGVVELARVYGRTVLVPQQVWNDEEFNSQCGVILYDLSKPLELAMKLIDLLNNPLLQDEVGKQGYQYTFLRRNSFSHAHLRVFETLASNQLC